MSQVTFHLFILLSGELAIENEYLGNVAREVEAVAGLPVEPVVLGSGSKARVMEVEFENGEIAVLPRANVEAIER